ncbi:MAG: prephenate dehydratase [Acidimicrobiia bacterium]
MTDTVNHKKPGKVAYLGPAGTFCHEAVMSQADLKDSELLPMYSIAEVFEAVDNREADLGVVPLENTIEGSVSLTLDMLVFDSEAMIQREIDHNISLCLATTKDGSIENLETIFSHPHALAQCRTYLENNLDSVKRKATDSTASAANLVAEKNNKTYAAICPTEAAKNYGLKILESHIQDIEFNQTRFIVIGNGIPRATEKDKTSIAVFQRANRPGSLVAILSEFASRSIDLTKLESRPTKEGLGQYCFLMDFVGHISNENISECLHLVRTEHADIKFLGSYQVAGDTLTNGSIGNSRQWKETDQWLSDLLSKVDKT